MTDRRILALSSSRTGESGYLATAIPAIQYLLGLQPLRVAFIPFAYVDANKQPLVTMLHTALGGLPYTIDVIEGKAEEHLLQQADAIMVSGGNTFKLLHDLYETGLLALIQDKVNSGTPYIGWSAGSNITGSTICTTNDMPIIEPQSFRALGFFPFQINPHYYNQPIAGFNGETRDQRLTEFVQLNPGKKVVCLPEGTALVLENGILRFIGITEGILMEYGEGRLQKTPIAINEDVSFLLTV